eukprot:CAMPEP_0119101384 /NCGR_PEP_ID=MMETSP1180-20130426/452_1 /TAXON_ID=3052 ORGANISM="Chlamydomonas cf sp, Strain CCMP681" /NCGR_SAMPLE_ID=MMETSP1180 /ASSEMBLY_ACC=CAM_ASM_000741 /LENGTH=146 /DNA_ID=CAMNT_0007085499 /DNA_START=56 /DNA_END=496 /DNA_ORIENTATION=+
MNRTAVVSRSAQPSRQRSVSVHAAFTKVATKSEVDAAGGRKVVEVNGTKYLLAESEGQVYAVLNKCSHLGLSLVGKTALLQGQVVNKCIVCPAHNTAFDLATGEVKGKWCPKLPEAISTSFGLTPPKPLPVFALRMGADGSIEIDV